MEDGAVRRPGAGRARGAGIAGILLLALHAPALAREETSVSVRGRVTDETGAAVPGHVVRLLKSRTILSLKSLKTRDQNVEEMRSTADARGFYEFEFPVDPQFQYYYLRFYDPKEFDSVKFVVPDDREISRRARRGRPVQADLILKLKPDWPEVKALIDTYGPGSHRGQILRALGLPSRRAPQGEGREIWDYDEAGVTYVIEGDRVLETRTAEGTARRGQKP